MGHGGKSRFKNFRVKKGNFYQKESVRGRCGLPRCRTLSGQVERYRLLNEELIRENAALKFAEKSNREFSVMFDRFLLKMGQSIPYIQGLKKHLEFAYDNLAQVETMVECFSNANSLRDFLLGETSFMFEPVQEDKDLSRSPLVKEAPLREHRRFDDEGEIETIVEENIEDEENIAKNNLSEGRATFLKVSSETSLTVRERRSSRRSSVGASRSVQERAQSKLSAESRASNQSTTISKSSETSPERDSLERRSDSQFPRSSLKLSLKSPLKRATYCKVPAPPDIVVSECDAQTSAFQPAIDDYDEPSEDLTVPIAGKSDGELPACFEATVVEPKLPIVEPLQIHERSPTAINVAQVWAAANAARPVERDPTCTDIAAAFREALQRLASEDVSPSASRVLPSLATTQFPSPVVCETSSFLPTSTPALNKPQHEPSSPGVSMIAAERDSSTLNTDVVLPETVDCRRRKRVVTSPKTAFQSPGKTRSLRKSVRFSAKLDESDVNEQTMPTKPVAVISSPFVKNALNTRKPKSRASLKSEAENPNDEAATSTETNDGQEPLASASRRTYIVKKKTSSLKCVGRKRSQQRSSKAADSFDKSNQPAEKTLTAETSGSPTAKRVKVTPETVSDTLRNNHNSSTNSSSSGSGTGTGNNNNNNNNNISNSNSNNMNNNALKASSTNSLRASSQSARGSLSSHDASAESRRRSRRAGAVSYVEPSLRMKMRRDA